MESLQEFFAHASAPHGRKGARGSARAAHGRRAAVAAWGGFDVIEYRSKSAVRV